MKENALRRQTDLDWVRAASMLGVVLLHASSGFVNRYSRISLGGVTPALLCNQAVRFAVPLFFLLSGLSLGLRDGPVKLPDFWLRRLRRTALPYVLWTLFYFLSARGFRLSGLAEPGALGELGRALLTGGAASHLWFIPTLLQLYLLYPLLRRLLRRRPWLTLGLSFALTLFCTLILYVPLPLTGWWRPRLWRLFPTWLFFFVLGAALTPERLARLGELCRKYALPLLLLGAAAALAYAWDARRSGDLDSIKPQLFLYTPLVFAALLGAWRYLRRIPWAERAAARLAEGSMTVYFSHVFFLGLLRRFPFLTANFPGMLGLFFATLALSLALGAVFRLIAGVIGRRSAGASPGAGDGPAPRRK